MGGEWQEVGGVTGEKERERKTSGNPLVREHGIVSRVHEPCRG